MPSHISDVMKTPRADSLAHRHVATASAEHLPYGLPKRPTPIKIHLKALFRGANNLVDGRKIGGYKSHIEALSGLWFRSRFPE
jgi:hypothetical protein